MKLFLFLVAVILTMGATGCCLLGETPEERHKLAVQKVTDYAEAVVYQKIDLSKNLTKAGKAKAKADVARIKSEILAKIEELRRAVKSAEAEEAADAPDPDCRM